MNTTTITPMKAWMQAATADEQVLLAERAGTTRAYLYHLSAPDSAAYKREPSTTLAAAIERETKAMSKASKGRLPVVYRTDLNSGCRACEYARKCLGPAVVDAGDFEIVTAARLAPVAAGSEGGTAD